MNTNNDNGGEFMQELNDAHSPESAVRISLFAPSSVYDAWKILEPSLKASAQTKSTLVRSFSPACGGPESQPGRQAPPAALEHLKTVALGDLQKGSQKLELYFKRANVPSAQQRRDRHYLSAFIHVVREQGWLPPAQTDEPVFNRFNKPKGQRRIYADEIKTTNRKRTAPYRLGTSKAHYVVIDGQPVLGNLKLAQQLKELTQYFGAARTSYEEITHWILRLLAFVLEHQQVPLEDLSLELLVPFIQLRFSEEDFEGHEAFQTTSSGQLINPMAAEQTLAMAEAMAQRRAFKASETTLTRIKEFFDWREQVLAEDGQPQGLEATTKHIIISALELTAEYLYQKETRFKRLRKSVKRQQNSGFQDIPVIAQLRQLYAEYPINRAAIKERIQKTRCTQWPEAMRVYEQQRQLALTYYIDCRHRTYKKGYAHLRRKLSGIAKDLQRTLILGFCLFVPTDRQESYRDLQFGRTLKCGYFQDDGETFIDQGKPEDLNQTQFWLDLTEFKTAETYGAFWYPVPNVTFVDGTTFYEQIGSWLWGFEDTAGNWPVCYPDDPHWQGYIDAQSNRHGWRVALQPDNHDYFFSQPNNKQPYQSSNFRDVIRQIFVRFTQETGKPVPVTPHSMRHMISSYLDKLDLSTEERQSFAYVMHHSLETHEKDYVYRDRLRRVTPAAERMRMILQDVTFDC